MKSLKWSSNLLHIGNDQGEIINKYVDYVSCSLNCMILIYKLRINFMLVSYPHLK